MHNMKIMNNKGGEKNNQFWRNIQLPRVSMQSSDPWKVFGAVPEIKKTNQVCKANKDFLILSTKLLSSYFSLSLMAAAATNYCLLSPRPLTPSPHRTRPVRFNFIPCVGSPRSARRPRFLRVRSSLFPDPFLLEASTVAAADLAVGEAAASVGYSPASYYTSLGLFVISVPGLWSLIKRSVKSKVNEV